MKSFDKTQDKKILIFSIAYAPFFGGAELAIKEITDRINDIQFDMVTLRFNKKWPKFEKIGNVNVYRIDAPKLFFPFLAFFKAVCLHRKNKYDAIWAMMAAYAGFAALFFKITHPKVFYLLTLQEGDPIEYIKKKVRFVYPLFSRIFTKADFIQTISNYLAVWARDMGYEKKLEVVPNGVDIENFSQKHPGQEIENLKNKLGKKPGDKYLITVSRLVLKNAVDDVIKSLRYLPENAKFLVLGDGQDLEKLQNLAKETGVTDRVIFLGNISHEKVPVYLEVSDIFIRPSLTEGLGNSFLEAMAAGIPVIATPVGGITDFLKDSETGVFCKARNPQSIAEKVKMLLENKELVQEITANAKEMVIKNYDWNLIAGKMRNIFEKI